MIYNEIDIQKFLASTDGQVLHRVRVERDQVAEQLELLADKPEAVGWIDQMARQEHPQSAFHALIEHFAGNELWWLCDIAKGFRSMCVRVSELERKAVSVKQEVTL
jgi:hypothetical protein